MKIKKTNTSALIIGITLGFGLWAGAVGLTACQDSPRDPKPAHAKPDPKTADLCLQPGACQGCGGPSGPPCPPQGQSGWLCCSESGEAPCSISSDQTCPDIFWCDLYTEEFDSNGATHVVCWDEWGQGAPPAPGSTTLEVLVP